MKVWNYAPGLCGFWVKGDQVPVAYIYLCNRTLHFHQSDQQQEILLKNDVKVNPRYKRNTCF